MMLSAIVRGGGPRAAAAAITPAAVARALRTGPPAAAPATPARGGPLDGGASTDAGEPNNTAADAPSEAGARAAGPASHPPPPGPAPPARAPPRGPEPPPPAREPEDPDEKDPFVLAGERPPRDGAGDDEGGGAGMSREGLPPSSGFPA
ncbi:hypothetical protein Rsub_08270 [Raphidocelis subcapitata]|uniref:Uncharacterized protein n=1 Tax=Raphidocelis subcapitata TaxID=307507 RepID=A0A2V0P7I7_9CHLO|nr:hypothetical protein Rsub_08270 [Raphidocelis subcapitata]|eukprot:GBF95834.1 hypothetical protein Rsub_08270 [Raphidocelis subcapitata]